VKGFLKGEDILFSLYLHLILLLRKEEVELKMGVKIKILNYSTEEKLYRELQLLKVEVNFQTLQ
jgi:hypothetical protein